MKSFASGTVHTTPTNVNDTLVNHPKIQSLWQEITPLARNEWICWVTSAKKEETRVIRLQKMVSKMSGGMRRPCCWEGCPHRK